MVLSSGHVLEESLSYPCLLTVRHRISRGEPVFLDSIFHLCRRTLANAEFKRDLALMRACWKDPQKGAGIKLVIDGRDISAREILDWWINGRYFHIDLTYRD
jgi:hypothetical protein